MKRIFVGGTGRSGTTIIQHALSFSPDIYAVPVETKFIVEVDGLSSLVGQVTDNFSSLSLEQIERFRYLMCEILTGRSPSPYITETYRPGEYLLPDLFPNYAPAVANFLSFLDANWKTTRPAFVEESRRLIDGLFAHEAQRRGKSGWAEKTPANLLRLVFLRELYPDCHFVHVVRDPRDVLESYIARGWLGEDPVLSVKRLKFMYEAWITAMAWARGRPRYIEIKMEDFIADPATALSRLAAKLGVEQHSEAGISCVLEAVRSYYGGQPDATTVSRRRQLQRQALYETLRPECLALGYQLASG